MIERVALRGAEMRERACVDQGRAFAKRAKGGTAFEKGYDPSQNAENHRPYENPRCVGAGFLDAINQAGDCHDHA